jgi:hypothetical protein
MLQSRIHLFSANAAIEDTSIHSKCHDGGYNYPQQMLQSRIHLSTATGVQLDTSHTVNAAIKDKDTTICSNWCAHKYISYIRYCN